MSVDDYWMRLVEIYNYSKTMHLLAEELDPDHETFLAPLLQHRDALDHIMRATAGKYRMLPQQPDTDHFERNLDKALGHAYRAFFDVADWFGIILREKVQLMLEGLPRECIQAIYPEYYTDWRPKIDAAPIRIVEIRSRKDVGDGKELIAEVQMYFNLLTEVHDVIRTIRAREGDVTEWMVRRNVSEPGRQSTFERTRTPTAVKPPRWGLSLLLSGLIGAMLASGLTILIMR